MIMNNKIIFGLILSIFIVISIVPVNVFAVDWVGNCTNNDTLLLTANYEYNNTNYNFNRTINCPYGCIDSIDSLGSECALPDYQMYFIIVIFVILFFIGLSKVT